MPKKYYHKDLKQQCTDIPPLYKESIQLAMTSIIALNLASGTYDEHLIANTFYYLAVYKGNNLEYRNKLSSISPVYKKIDLGVGRSIDFSNAMFNIWYLRQIPSVAEKKYQTMNAPEPWQYYIDQAKDMMSKNPRLNTAFGFGYTPRRSSVPIAMQPFSDTASHPEWFSVKQESLVRKYIDL